MSKYKLNLIFKKKIEFSVFKEGRQITHLFKISKKKKQQILTAILTLTNCS